MSDGPATNPKFILSLPQNVLESLPGGTPPPGMQALSPNPATLRPQTIAVGSVFLVIATIFFAIRVYVKAVLIRRIGLDDYVCTAAFAFSIVQFAGIMLAQTQGAAGRHNWDSTVAQLISYPNCISAWMTTVFVTPALALAKLTFLIQYYQLFWPLRWVRVACWSVGSVFELAYLAITITMFVICSPWPGESWQASLLSKHYNDAGKMSIPTGAIGAAFDVFLLVLPMKAVSTLQLPRQKKHGLYLVFLIGALASVASIVGLAYRVKTHDDTADTEWWVTHFWVWVQVELFLGIACSCMLAFSRLLSRRGSGGGWTSFSPRRIFGSKVSEETREKQRGRDEEEQGRPENHGIHLVQEVSVYEEEKPRAGEREAVDQRW